jgi:hypothetical protein
MALFHKAFRFGLIELLVNYATFMQVMNKRKREISERSVFIPCPSVAKKKRKEWSQRLDLNQRPALYESAALPTELRWQPLHRRKAGMPDSIINTQNERARSFRTDPGTVYLDICHFAS